VVDFPQNDPVNDPAIRPAKKAGLLIETPGQIRTTLTALILFYGRIAFSPRRGAGVVPQGGDLEVSRKRSFGY
jgi:hypothetical protein